MVKYSDLEQFLCAWYRDALGARGEAICRDVVVANAEPSAEEGPFPTKLLVINDNGGPDTSLMTGERAVRLSVLAGTRAKPDDAVDLALIVHALRTQIPAPGFATALPDAPRNPVTSVLDSNGPFAVEELQDRARRLITMTLGVSPEPF